MLNFLAAKIWMQPIFDADINSVQCGLHLINLGLIQRNFSNILHLIYQGYVLFSKPCTPVFQIILSCKAPCTIQVPTMCEICVLSFFKDNCMWMHGELGVPWKVLMLGDYHILRPETTSSLIIKSWWCIILKSGKTDGHAGRDRRRSPYSFPLTLSLITFPPYPDPRGRNTKMKNTSWITYSHFFSNYL